jgi:hypothetical protein
MKNIKTILGIITILGSLTASSQHFAMKLGLNGTNLPIENSDNGKIKPGFIVGMLLNFELSDKFQIQPELLFGTWGAKYDIDGQDKDDALAFTGFTLPLMFKYSLIPKLMFEFGPSMTFFTNTEYQDNGEPKNTLDVNDLYKSSDLGLNVGLTLSPAERIDLGLRYYLGLTNLSTLDPDVSGVNIKSTAIQLALTCSF